MSFALLIAGTVLLVAGVRNTQGDLFGLVKGDFTGDGNFIFWFSSILAIGAVGYIPRLKPISEGFLVLVVLALFLSDKGFFAAWTKQIQAGTGVTAKPATAATGLPSLNSLSSIFV